MHQAQIDYLEEHAEHCRFVANLGSERREDVLMMSVMADLETLAQAEVRALGALGSRVRTHRLENRGWGSHILEILAPGTGKWAALVRVAEAEGIAADEIAAVGDDLNDLDLVSQAGLGIAMGNAVAEVREAADLVVAGNERDGVVEAIGAVLTR